MRFDTTLVQVAMCLASWSSVTAAWPDSLAEGNYAIGIRQDNNDNKDNKDTSSKVEESETTKPPVSKTSEQPKETGKDKNTSKGGDKTTKETGTPTGTRSHSPTRTRFPPEIPAGGVTMISPATLLEPTPLYKLKEKVTFAWNYTSLKGKPTAIDVLVSCDAAKATWTLTGNMSFASQVTYTWDTKKQATDAAKPLPIELYTLMIKDSDTEITDQPEAGYLAKYTGLTFGLYEPAKPTKWEDWECTGCSAAPSLFERPALGLAVTMSLVSLLSFTWFVTGLGL